MNSTTPAPDQFIIADEDQPAKAPETQPRTFKLQPPASNPALTALTSSIPQVDVATASLPSAASSAIANVRERQFQGGDTLDEPVWHTLRRDVSQIGRRLAVVVWPVQLRHKAREHQERVVQFAARAGVRLSGPVAESVAPEPARDVEAGAGANDAISSDTILGALDWDLWGPLVFLFVYAGAAGAAAPALQKNVVFSNTFALIWLFYVVVGVNIQLLGGSISFLSAISATGYLMFPIAAAAVVCTLLLSRGVIRLIVMTVATNWSVYAAMVSLLCSGVLPGRVFLTLLPVCLLYIVLAWLVVIT